VETAAQILRLVAATAQSIASVHVAILNRHPEEKTSLECSTCTGTRLRNVARGTFTVQCAGASRIVTVRRRIEDGMRLVRIPVDAPGCVSLAWRSSPPIAGAVPRRPRDPLRSGR
jgi:hypothetical protein